MFRTAALTTFALLAVANAQLAGTNVVETHPAISVQQCTASGSCTTKQASIVLDSNWRWIHVKGGYTNCYTGSEWNSTVCSDPKACAEVCLVSDRFFFFYSYFGISNASLRVASTARPTVSPPAATP